MNYHSQYWEITMHMKKLVKRVILLSMLPLIGLYLGCGKKREADYPIKPVPFTQVRFTDTFWLPRMETNRKVTIPHAFKKCEENGRMDNFAIAGGLKEGEHRGIYPFDDTDIYKVLEGASYALMLHPDPELDKYLDELIEIIGAAQESDGYLYTVRTNNAERLKNWYGDERWIKIRGSHELYNAGHLYEAAVAHFQATGKPSLLNIAIKNADLIDRVFGPDKLQVPPGHQVIEMGLAKLYRITGEERYLNLAKFLLDVRGHSYDSRELWGEYNQDHKPVIEQDEAVGHAVRASYMYSGMADIAALSGDTDYLKAIGRIWENVVGKKLHLTGGIGAMGSGEAFGDNYELPNMSAYNETCAAVGNVYWNHRLFLLHGDAKYIDVMERTLYNGLISGISLDGKLFFYPNPLESVGQHSRSSWFGCACCPGNVTRFMASVPGYVYAYWDKSVYINLFVNSKGKIDMSGRTVSIHQETEYPWKGTVKMTLDPEPAGKFALHVRIPGWARNQPIPSDLYRFMNQSDKKVTITVNGSPFQFKMKNGFARIERSWEKNDMIVLNLPMPIRRVLALDSVAADQGRVALQRGPIVYCAEWPDNEGGHVRNLFLSDNAVVDTEFREDMLHGVQIIQGKAVGYEYGDVETSVRKSEQDFIAIPYYAWAHRGKGEMAVWLARDESAVHPLSGPTLASMSGGSNSD